MPAKWGVGEVGGEGSGRGGVGGGRVVVGGKSSLGWLGGVRRWDRI